MSVRPFAHTLGAAVLLLAGPVFALPLFFSGDALGATEPGAPTAIVTDQTGVVPNPPLLGFARVGERYTLGQGGRLALGYLASCVEETIVGGTVTIGENQSIVRGGNVERRKVECDSAGLVLTETQLAEGGVTVFREDKPPGSIEVDLTIHGTKPLVTLPPGAKQVLWRRLDKPGPMKSAQAVNGVVDFEGRADELVRGGLYSFDTVDGNRVVVRVHKTSAANGVPTLSRLITFLWDYY